MPQHGGVQTDQHLLGLFGGILGLEVVVAGGLEDWPRKPLQNSTRS